MASRMRFRVLPKLLSDVFLGQVANCHGATLSMSIGWSLRFCVKSQIEIRTGTRCQADTIANRICFRVFVQLVSDVFLGEIEDGHGAILSTSIVWSLRFCVKSQIRTEMVAAFLRKVADSIGDGRCFFG